MAIRIPDKSQLGNVDAPQQTRAAEELSREGKVQSPPLRELDQEPRPAAVKQEVLSARGQHNALSIRTAKASVDSLKNSAAEQLLAKYDADPGAFDEGMSRIYGKSYDAGAMHRVIDELRQGNFASFKYDVQLVGGDVMGHHDAAFSGKAIYVNRDLQTMPVRMQRVFNEEFLGHGLTAIVTDRPWDTTKLGDEGESLARWLAGGDLGKILESTKNEHDFGTITVDGKQTRVRLFTDTSTRYQTKQAFDVSNWLGAATAKLDAQVERSIVDRYKGEALADGTPVTTLDHVKAFLAEQIPGAVPPSQVAEITAMIAQGRDADSPGGDRIWKSELSAIWNKALSDGKLTPDEAALFEPLVGTNLSSGAKKLIRDIVDNQIPTLLSGGVVAALKTAEELLADAQGPDSPGGERVWKNELKKVWAAAKQSAEAEAGKPINPEEAALFTSLVGGNLSGGAKRLLDEIVAELPAVTGPAGTGSSGDPTPRGDFAKVEAEVRALVYGDDPAARKDETARSLSREALAASVLAHLKDAKVVDESVKLDTPLTSQQARAVADDPDMAQASPTTWGELMRALTTDINADNRRDISAFALQRYVGASQQEILRALTSDLSGESFDVAMKATGFNGSLDASAKRSLELAAPSAFGLSGRTEIDRLQQQLLLRNGMIFADSNEDGKIDDSDAIRYLSNGKVQETTYGDLSDGLKRLIRFNTVVARETKAYADLAKGSYSARIRFPSYSASTGQSAPERVNEDFWSVDTVSYGRTSWEMKEGVLPSDAFADALTGNGGKYTTECAHGRTIIRVHATHRYYEEEFGEGEGTFRFNALFGKTAADKSTAAGYIRDWTSHKAANPDATWEQFTATNPPPTITYYARPSRHLLVDESGGHINIWRDSPLESAAGTTGYFHNKSVSPLGVRIGYIGENVIDLGYIGGDRIYWGHPGGYKKESRWQAELASGDIQVKKISDFQQYFETLEARRSLTKSLERRHAASDKEISELQDEKPTGWEAKVEKLQDDKAWMTALYSVRKAFSDSIKKDSLQAARDATARGYDSPAETAAFVDTLSESGQREVRAAFKELPEKIQTELAKKMGVDEVADLSDAQMAQAAAFETFVLQGNRIHQVLRDEINHAVASGFAAQWFDGELSSRSNFETWLATPKFAAWYEEKAGQAFSGSTALADMSTDQIQEIVEYALPSTAHMNTAYGEMSRDITVGKQMAMLLKDNKLPAANFGSEPSLAPLD